MGNRGIIDLVDLFVISLHNYFSTPASAGLSVLESETLPFAGCRKSILQLRPFPFHHKQSTYSDSGVNYHPLKEWLEG